MTALESLMLLCAFLAVVSIIFAVLGAIAETRWYRRFVERIYR